MEIKATLNVPFTDIQKCDFIVEQNHKNGYEIRYTEQAIEAWGLDETEETQKEKEQKIQQYKYKLKEIDEKSARSIRSKLAGTSTEEDDAYLATLEEQAIEYRQKIKELQDTLGE